MEKSYQMLLMVGCVIVLLLGTLIFLGSASTRVERVSAHPLELSSDQIASVPLNATADDVPTYYVYLPLALNAYPEPTACNPIPGQMYAAISVVPEGSQPPSPSAEEDPGFNVNLFEFRPVQESKQLFVVDEEAWTAPQLAYVYENPHIPTIKDVYHLYYWDGIKAPDQPAVSALGIPTVSGQVIHVPQRFGAGTDIDNAGYKVLVLYASQESIALKYTREDGLAGGYTVYIDGICVEPDLQTLYNETDEAGRNNLPALFGQQPLGRAWGDEIRLVVRDRGALMDPRWRDDWWCYPR